MQNAFCEERRCVQLLSILGQLQIKLGPDTLISFFLSPQVRSLEKDGDDQEDSNLCDEETSCGTNDDDQGDIQVCTCGLPKTLHNTSVHKLLLRGEGSPIMNSCNGCYAPEENLKIMNPEPLQKYQNIQHLSFP